MNSTIFRYFDSPEVRRGKLLTVFLVFSMLSSLVTAVLYLATPDRTSEMMRQAGVVLSPMQLTVQGILTLMVVVAGFGTWIRKRWGIYLFVAVSIVGSVMNLTLGLPLLTVVTGLIGIPMLVGLLMRLSPETRSQGNLVFVLSVVTAVLLQVIAPKPQMVQSSTPSEGPSTVESEDSTVQQEANQ